MLVTRFPDDQRTNVTSIYKTHTKGDSGNYRFIGFTAVPGKVMKCVLPKAIINKTKGLDGETLACIYKKVL